jgi:rfaE bifunctional protein kinase chain/domain
MTSTDAARCREIIRRFTGVRLVVAGDLIADEFIYGQIERVSREAPVLILKYDATEIVPGGAGNAASNAAALGAIVDVVGVVGRDDAGRRLTASLRAAGARTRGIAAAAGYVTPVKTRILAGGVHSAKQQVVRVDRIGPPVSPVVHGRMAQSLARALVRADAVIVSDYGHGLITPQVWRRAKAASSQRAAAGPLSFVDSRYNLAGFRGLTASTPNEPEVEALLGVRIDDDAAMLERAGRAMLKRLRSRAVLITRGSRGMALFEPGRPTDLIPIVGSDQIADVTGAGDTVIATFAVARAAGATFREAARLANYAGGLVVMKRGTATVTAAELAAALPQA